MSFFNHFRLTYLSHRNVKRFFKIKIEKSLFKVEVSGVAVFIVVAEVVPVFVVNVGFADLVVVNDVVDNVVGPVIVFVILVVDFKIEIIVTVLEIMSFFSFSLMLKIFVVVVVTMLLCCYCYCCCC